MAWEPFRRVGNWLGYDVAGKTVNAPPEPSRGFVAYVNRFLGGWRGPRAAARTPVEAGGTITVADAVEREEVRRGPPDIVFPNFAPYLDEFTQGTGETTEIRMAYRRMLADANVKASLYNKILAVGDLDLKFHPAKKRDPIHQEIADFNRWVFNDVLGGPPKLVVDVLMPGLIDGYAVAEKVVGRPEEKGRWRMKVPFEDLASIDTFNDIVPETDDRRRVVNIRGLRYNAGRNFHPARFVIWSHMPLFGQPTGLSDFRAAYRPYWIADTAWKLWILMLRLRSGGLLKGKYSSPTVQQSLEAALAEAKTAGWISLPESAEVEVLNLSAGGDAAMEAAMKAAKHDIFLCIEGAMLQSLEGETPDGRGDSGVQKGTAQLRVRWLARALERVLNGWRNPVGLVHDVTDLNYVTDEYPKATLSTPDLDKAKNYGTIIKSAQDIGLKPSRSWSAEMLGIEEADPADPEDALEAPKPAGPPGMPPGGPGGDDKQPPAPKEPPKPGSEAFADGAPAGGDAVSIYTRKPNPLFVGFSEEVRKLRREVRRLRARDGKFARLTHRGMERAEEHAEPWDESRVKRDEGGKFSGHTDAQLHAHNADAYQKLYGHPTTGEGKAKLKAKERKRLEGDLREGNEEREKREKVKPAESQSSQVKESQAADHARQVAAIPEGHEQVVSGVPVQNRGGGRFRADYGTEKFQGTVEEVAADIARRVSPPPTASSAPPISSPAAQSAATGKTAGASLHSAIADAVAKFEKERRADIPLHALYAAAQAAHPGLSLPDFKETLKNLHARGVIRLSSAFGTHNAPADHKAAMMSKKELTGDDDPHYSNYYYGHARAGENFDQAATSDPTPHVLAAVTAHAGPHNLADMRKVRQHLADAGVTDRAEQDAAIHAARQAGHVSGVNWESSRGMAPEEAESMQAALHRGKAGDERVGYLSHRRADFAESHHVPPELVSAAIEFLQAGPEKFAEGKWVTVGASGGSDGERHGGTPMFIKDGKIEKGPAHAIGKAPHELSKKAAGENTSHKTEEKASQSIDKGAGAKVQSPGSGGNQTKETKMETTTQQRPLSEVLKDFRTAQMAMNTTADKEGWTAKAHAAKAELAALLPPLRNDTAGAGEKKRQDGVRDLSARARDLERQAAEQRSTVQYSPHMAGRLAETEKELATVRAALDLIPKIGNGQWWAERKYPGELAREIVKAMAPKAVK